ncbi:MAG: aminopeptidase P family protein [Pseudomonadota bacterium]
MKTMTYGQKLEALRAEMAAQNIHVYLVPRTDEFLGESITPNAERLAWISGFTGSAGIGIILEDTACVMSDGRYTIQLTQEVDQNYFELENSQEVTPFEWLEKQIKSDDIIGFDPKLFSPAFIEKLEDKNLKLKSIDQNLIDNIWEDQPDAPVTQAFLFPNEVAGKTAAEKIEIIQNEIIEQKCDELIITQLDSIAWLLNIRGNDISDDIANKGNAILPVIQSYLILPREGKARWYVNPEKLSEDVKSKLLDIVSFHAFKEIEHGLYQSSNRKIWYDPKRSSDYFKQKLNTNSDALYEADDPCIFIRSQKTEPEQKAMKDAHIKDGVALVKFLKWFEENAQNGDLDELTVEAQLEEFRKQSPDYKEPSFSTIAGFGANGAIVHYRANEKTNKKIESGNFLLLDSGGHYHYGTTDITRTIPVGNVSDEMKKAYTLVLKGHIALARAKFDPQTLGKDLDDIARKPLLDHDMNYSHGTGHGVGCYLSVHEEAPSISPRGEQPFKPGMILSNEPGYYKEDEFGIRIENLVLVKSEQQEFYFETITCAPIETSCILESLLEEEEKKWLNQYHQSIFEKLAPFLDENHKNWLTEKVKLI